MIRPSWLTALLAAGACAVPLTTAAAASTCKSTVTSQPVADVDGPDAAWQSAVTTMYGGDWDNLSTAQNKRYYDINLGLGKLYYMSAQPCRNTIVVTPPRVTGSKTSKQSP